MKPIHPLFLTFAFQSVVVLAAFCAAPVGTVSDVAGPAMMQSFLKNEAVRLDSKFLEGITNRQQWEARRSELHKQYLEMLGLWPLPERTPLNPKITGTLEREEGFRVEKLHFQS